MILIVSFPGMSRTSINFESLLREVNPEFKSKLHLLSNVRKELVLLLNPSLPIDEIIIKIDNYCSLLIEASPHLWRAKCKPPKFAWISAIHSSEQKIETKGSSNY